jgi:hypothetical protein
MKKKRIDIVTINKCKIFSYDRWCGYLTPTEILSLVDYGIEIDKFNEWVVNNAKKNKKIGISNPTWFYFKPNEDFLQWHMKTLRKLKRYDK